MLSVVIPTMWKYPPFVKFLEQLVKVDAIGEIVLINNDVAKTPSSMVFSNPKIKHLAQQRNIFVNPSWNLGVYTAKYNNVCILNDDVIVDFKLFYVMDEFMKNNIGVAGICPGDPAFNQIPFTNGQIDIVPWSPPSDNNKHGNLFGFGTLYFIDKRNWFDIPDGLDFYFGDDWVFETQRLYGRQNFIITNCHYYTPSAQTCTQIMTKEKYSVTLEREREIYHREFDNFKTQSLTNYIETEYRSACGASTDIYRHLPRLRELAKDCETVVELGVRDGQSTRAFLPLNMKLRSYDIVLDHYVEHLFNTCIQHLGKDFQYIKASSLEIELEPMDLLFIDTEHSYGQLSQELRLHGNKAKKYIACHDTVTYGKALMPAIQEFLNENRNFRIKKHYEDCNGLLVMERIS